MELIETFKSYKSFEVASGIPGDYDKLFKRYKTIVKNTKQFNGNAIKTKREKSANGETTKFYHSKTGKLLRSVSIVCDRYSTEVWIHNFEQDLERKWK